MARGTSTFQVGWCLVLLLGGAPARTTAQDPQNDLSGTWGSNIGISYTITQSGGQITWVDTGGRSRRSRGSLEPSAMP